MGWQYKNNRLLLAAGTALLLFSAVVILLIWSGVFDPKPLGPMIDHQEPNEQFDIDELAQVRLYSAPLPQSYTIRLRAAWLSGSQDIAYGLRFGNESMGVAAAVSPLGYIAVYDAGQNSNTGDLGEYHLEWQTWPHVKLGPEENELWIDVTASEIVSIRLNRELLWEGQLPFNSDQIWFWADSFAEPAVLQLDEYELYGSR